MKIFSSVFENEGAIPLKYTKKGGNTTPSITFKDIPENAKSLALIMDDPGGPLITFVHWTIWNIPPTVTGLLEGEKIEYPQGKNSYQKLGYLGPCPPFGKHQYIFKIYALDIMIDLEIGAKKKQLDKAMAGHIVAEAQLIGYYKK